MTIRSAIHRPAVLARRKAFHPPGIPKQPPVTFMGSSLSLHDPVKTLQRDLADLLQKAADELAHRHIPLATRVHELRKRLKRARAWAQILPKPLARSVDKALRDVHRRLGARRDFDATLEAIARLLASAREQGRDSAVAALLQLRDQLRQAHEDGARQVQQPGNIDALVGAARRDLQALAELIRNSALDGGFSLLSESAADTARRSRHAMHKAIKSGDAHDYHRWRKWMKYHWFHLRYLAPLWPELLRVEALAAEHTAEWLGQSQDIELVRAAVALSLLGTAQRQTLGSLLEREQQQLLRRAASIGLHLHAETPRAFAKRLNNYGKARRYRG